MPLSLLHSPKLHDDPIPALAPMRQSILEATPHSPLVRDALERAQRHNFTDEELYVWLAYQALVRLEELERANGIRDLSTVDPHFW